MSSKSFGSSNAKTTRKNHILEAFQDMLTHIRPELKELIYRCMIFRWFNSDIIKELSSTSCIISDKMGYITDVDSLVGVEADLQALSFVEPYDEDSYQFHELVREVVLQHLWQYDHEFLIEVSRYASDYFYRRVTQAAPVAIVENTEKGEVIDKLVGSTLAVAAGGSARTENISDYVEYLYHLVVVEWERGAQLLHAAFSTWTNEPFFDYVAADIALNALMEHVYANRVC